MLQLRKTLSLIFAVLLLVQPVFAETVDTAPPTVPPEPDLISAVYSMEELPSNWSPLSPATTERTWLRDQTTTPIYKLSADGSWLPVLAAELPEELKRYGWERVLSNYPDTDPSLERTQWLPWECAVFTRTYRHA